MTIQGIRECRMGEEDSEEEEEIIEPTTQWFRSKPTMLFAKENVKKTHDRPTFILSRDDTRHEFGIVLQNELDLNPRLTPFHKTKQRIMKKKTFKPKTKAHKNLQKDAWVKDPVAECLAECINGVVSAAERVVPTRTRHEPLDEITRQTLLDILAQVASRSSSLEQKIIVETEKTTLTETEVRKTKRDKSKSRSRKTEQDMLTFPPTSFNFRWQGELLSPIQIELPNSSQAQQKVMTSDDPTLLCPLNQDEDEDEDEMMFQNLKNSAHCTDASTGPDVAFAGERFHRYARLDIQPETFELHDRVIQRYGQHKRGHVVKVRPSDRYDVLYFDTTFDKWMHGHLLERKCVNHRRSPSSSRKKDHTRFRK